MLGAEEPFRLQRSATHNGATSVLKPGVGRADSSCPPTSSSMGQPRARCQGEAWGGLRAEGTQGGTDPAGSGERQGPQTA